VLHMRFAMQSVNRAAGSIVASSVDCPSAHSIDCRLPWMLIFRLSSLCKTVYGIQIGESWWSRAGLKHEFMGYHMIGISKLAMPHVVI